MGQNIGIGGGIGIGAQVPPLDLEDPVLAPDAILDPDAPENYEGEHAGYPQAAEEADAEEEAGGRV